MLMLGVMVPLQSKYIDIVPPNQSMKRTNTVSQQLLLLSLKDMFSSTSKTESDVANQIKISLSEDDNSKNLQNDRSHESNANLRPTTSRGKPHPSPNEFFDYVVPSPVVKLVPEKEPGKRVIIFDESSNFEQSYELVETDNSNTEEDDATSSDDKKRREKLRLLGCWLFGTTLRI
eukprot:CAMPEP_0170093144 /NCGR_PEP_ID=MMETSP0019_2-20121128/26307_1 /TAXON_ID=98059 /ORGANISM="Dinobryon sp., Strain UTEXLB2267" /LENGTH=174 /DNA_ID=CAMNT_0010313871 /DNA_START=1 /DNA_END=525 /DNA_ORIENTATION=-